MTLHNKEQADGIFQDFFLFLVDKPIPADIRDVKGYLYRAEASAKKITDSLQPCTNIARKCSLSHAHSHCPFISAEVFPETLNNGFSQNQYEIHNQTINKKTGRFSETSYTMTPKCARPSENFCEIAKNVLEVQSGRRMSLRTISGASKRT